MKAKLTGRASRAARKISNRDSTSAPISAARSNRRSSTIARSRPATATSSAPAIHADLDELRELMAGGKQWMAEYQAAECQRTGIPSMKVGFNSVFGYYLEVTHTHREKVPADYIRKQTLKNAERYITPRAQGVRRESPHRRGQAKELEYELFAQLRDMVAAAAARLQATAAALAEIDVLACLAELARSRNYCRPTVVAEPVLEIEAGRHPVLDITEAGRNVRTERSSAAPRGGE